MLEPVRVKQFFSLQNVLSCSGTLFYGAKSMHLTTYTCTCMHGDGHMEKSPGLELVHWELDVIILL